MKKVALMALAWIVLVSPSVLATDMDVSITVGQPAQPAFTIGAFSVGLFATVMVAGFIIYIIRALFDIDLTNGNDLINRAIIITVIGLLLTSAIGIIFAL